MKAIRLKFRGADYVVPANRAFELGCQVEEIVTLGEIGTWGGKVPFFKVARCFGTMLRFAGARVSDEEVFSDIMANLRSAGPEGGAAEIAAVAAVQALAACLMGGAPLADGEQDAPEKTTAS